ncbi:putative fatty acyl-CoA reductase CG5065 [Teleopsis dalmanni]|uniref:putative fatty acyl-CoA reductase CG5065 n=1 Tax=Teleopsis dalmanni TaxID=139649 RepID=UPI0018CF0D53|nr:putative fatty acyl-CoA reductase CG5065 [Teleopsis dalmanni]
MPSADYSKKPNYRKHVHVIAASVNRRLPFVLVFQACADWRTTIRLAQTYDEDTLETLSLKYINPSPNTYTFTKNLAEQIINEYRYKLPVVIFRPSIVLPALKEPLPGWIDNLNGSIGLMLACSLGILRTNYITHSLRYDQVPVDMVVRAMLIACFKKGYLSRDDNNLDVYNMGSKDYIRLNLREFLILAEKECKKNPFKKTLWTPGGKPTLCPFTFVIRYIFLQLLLSYLGDIGLRLSGQKPFLFKLQRRIFVANNAIRYFTNRDWIFKNDKSRGLETIIPKSEIDKFGLTEYLHRDEAKITATYIRGLKVFLMNEPEEASKGTWRRFKILTYTNYLLQFLTVLIAVRFLIYLLF